MGLTKIITYVICQTNKQTKLENTAFTIFIYFPHFNQNQNECVRILFTVCSVDCKYIGLQANFNIVFIHWKIEKPFLKRRRYMKWPE